MANNQPERIAQQVFELYDKNDPTAAREKFNELTVTLPIAIQKDALVKINKLIDLDSHDNGN